MFNFLGSDRFRRSDRSVSSEYPYSPSEPVDDLSQSIVFQMRIRSTEEGQGQGEEHWHSRRFRCSGLRCDSHVDGTSLAGR